LPHQDLIQQHIVSCFEALHVKIILGEEGTVYNAAGIVSFHASPPNISSHKPTSDHGLFSRALLLMTTATHITNFRISFIRTAVDEKYRSPLITGMMRE
jgi:hypothetical protein